MIQTRFNTLNTDIIIIGGGIVGLWVLNLLRQHGYSVILIEKTALGAEQTIHSQGIIHSGAKYAASQLFSRSTTAISEMAGLWEACFAGKGSIDLSGVKIASPYYYFYASANLWQRSKQFIASKLIHSPAQRVTYADYPTCFQAAPHSSSLYQVAEKVLDVSSLIHVLATPHTDTLLQATVTSDNLLFSADKALRGVRLMLDDTPVEIQAQHTIFTAGEGNVELLKHITHAPTMQRRPLRMTYVKPQQAHNIFAHFLGNSTVPRLSITTHTTQTGECVWYLGGQLAEEGVQRSTTEQADYTQNELTQLMPWISSKNLDCHSFIINRAEAQQPNHQRPPSYFSQTLKNVTVAWPTKLTFTPALAKHMLQSIPDTISPSGVSADLSAYPKPPLAATIWEQML